MNPRGETIVDAGGEEKVITYELGRELPIRTRQTTTFLKD